MAKCTLDDLVPSIKCKRVFLEPLGASYSEYQVQIEACVYDTVEDEDDGIADYLLTDTFRENIASLIIYSRDASIENMVNFLKFETSFPEWAVTLLITAMVVENDMIASGTDASTDEKIEEFLSNLYTEEFFNVDFGSTAITDEEYLDTLSETHSVFIMFGGSGGLENNNLRLTWIDLLGDISKARRDGRIEVVDIDFSDYTSDFVNNHYANYGTNYGEVNLDDDGNRIYELLLPRTELKFTNTNQVKYCYAHMFCMVNLNDILEEAGMTEASLGPDVETYLRRMRKIYEYSIGSIHACRILSEGVAASSAVQDFRLSERIDEIIQPSRITTYDSIIDNVSLITQDSNVKKSGITTDLFLSYKVTPGLTTKIHTEGIFYISMSNLLRQNTKHSFLYDFLPRYFEAIGVGDSISTTTYDEQLIIGYFMLFKQTKIIKADIYRNRTDKKGGYHRERIATLDTIDLEYSHLDGDDQVMFKFYDVGFRDLTHGTYRYEIDLRVVDPIFDFVESRVHKLKYGISVYKNAIEYIHNNAQNYNEIRDTLNSQAETDLQGILSKVSNDGITFNDYMSAFFDLFLMFTGISITLGEYTTDFLVETFTEGLEDPTLPAADVPMIKSLIKDLKAMTLDYDASDRLQRRRLENQLRVMEDLLFSISKFFEIDAINSKTASTVQSSKELISYSRMWNEEVNPRLLESGVIKLASDYDTLSEFSLSAFRTRMEKELKFYGLENTYSESAEFGSVSPLSIQGRVVSEDHDEDAFIALFSNLLEMGTASDREIKYYQQLMSHGGSRSKFEKSANDIRNNSGMFETFLANLAGTCDNVSVASLGKYLGSSNNSGRRTYSRAIDEGENLSLSEATEHGEVLIETTADVEDLSTSERRALIKEELGKEARKKEDLIMKILLHRDGYSVLDRKDFIQGERRDTRFENNFDFSQYIQQNSRAFPSGWQTNQAQRLFNKAFNGTNNESNSLFVSPSIPAHRFIVDNTHLIYYLNYIDVNMNPVWTHLVNLGAAKNSAKNGKILCKFKRYQNSDLNIGQGSSSDREILSKYFYLNVGS